MPALTVSPSGVGAVMSAGAEYRRLISIRSSSSAIRSTRALVRGGSYSRLDSSSVTYQEIRTEKGLATRIMRLSTSTPRAISPCWFDNVRARSRGPIATL